MSIRERGLYTGLDAHEERQLRAQRDDAVDTLAELAPLREATIRLYQTHYADPAGGSVYQAAWEHWNKTVSEHIDEYGEDPL